MNEAETNFAHTNYGKFERVWARRQLRDLYTVEQFRTILIPLESDFAYHNSQELDFEFASRTLAMISEGSAIPAALEEDLSKAYERHIQQEDDNVEEWAENLATAFVSHKD